MKGNREGGNQKETEGKRAKAGSSFSINLKGNFYIKLKEQLSNSGNQKQQRT